jgi:hypothetical protein
LTVFFIRFGMGVLVSVYSEDIVIGGSNLIILETSMTSFLALPLTYGVGSGISSSNGFFFFLLSTRIRACLEEKCLRVLVLGLRARFSKESLAGDSLVCRLDRSVKGMWNLIFIY